MIYPGFSLNRYEQRRERFQQTLAMGQVVGFFIQSLTSQMISNYDKNF